MTKEVVARFLSDLSGLSEKMGIGRSEGCNYSKEVERVGLERQLFEYQEKEKQIQEDIVREIEDFFSKMHVKKASLEALTAMNDFISQEIKRLEELLKSQ